MNTQELIIVTTFCQQYEVELNFVNDLESIGLIDIITYNNEQYLHSNQLVTVEKIIRLHNELHINKEGIDVVFELLDKIKLLNKEVHELKNRLDLYE